MADEAEQYSSTPPEPSPERGSAAVDHVVVATGNGFIDPSSLQDRQFEGSFQEPPALPVVHEIVLLLVNRIENEPPGM